MSQYALIAPSIQIAGNVITRNRKSVVNLSVAEHFHDQLMADPMENVLSCAAVLARPGHHWPQSWCVRCEVWRLKIWRSQLGVVLLIFMIYCQSPAFILSSDTNWSTQINYSDTFNFQNTKKWKWSLPCLNTSSCARLSGHQWTVSWKMNTDHGDQIFSVGGL